jgi:mono/diheme cytochrome c family protein
MALARNRRSMVCVGVAAALLSGAWVLSGGASSPDSAAAQVRPMSGESPTPDEAKFFQSKIKPILADTCFSCHGNGKHKGGLKMDTRADLLKGGEDGPVVVPGKPKDSDLIKAIRFEVDDEDKKMPPPDKKPKLSEQQIADMTKWVEMGVPYAK